MKTILSIAQAIVNAILLMLSLFGCNQESVGPDQIQEFTVTSLHADASYPVRVGLPSAYNPATTVYKTVYVLDGEENFGFVTKKCQELSQELSVANVIVISIGYGNSRDHDYTPTVTGVKTGGAPNFMKFLEKELVPEVTKRFNVDTTRSGRTILGHSYGGLFGMYAFTTNNNVFGNYILLSPSIWYDNEVTLQYESKSRAENNGKKQLVFLGQGEMENSGRMQAPLEAFYQILTKNYRDIRVTKHLEKGLDHVGSKNPNIALGLKFYFENQSR